MKFEPGILAAGRPAALGERADARSGADLNTNTPVYPPPEASDKITPTVHNQSTVMRAKETASDMANRVVGAFQPGQLPSLPPMYRRYMSIIMICIDGWMQETPNPRRAA